MLLNAHSAGSHFSTSVTMACVWRNIRKYTQTNEISFAQGWCRKKRLVWNKFNSSAVTRPGIVSYNLSTAARAFAPGNNASPRALFGVNERNNSACSKKTGVGPIGANNSL